MFSSAVYDGFHNPLLKKFEAYDHGSAAGCNKKDERSGADGTHVEREGEKSRQGDGEKTQ